MKITAKLAIIFLLQLGICFSQNLQDSLVAYYPFNGNAYDESDNGNNGLVSGAELIQDRAGKDSSAYSFDGIDDYITLPSDFDFPQRTICLWFKATDVNFYHRIYNSDHPNLKHSSTNIDVYFDDYTNEWKLRLEAGGGQGEDIIYTIEEDTWYHAVLVIDTLHTQAFINGQLVETVPFVNHHSDKGEPFAFIGTNRDTSKYFFNGSIDDVRIYNRSLTENEISYLYMGPLTQPFITNILDVPQDQGGWVIVNFNRSVYDTDTLKFAKTMSAELYTVEINDGSGWIAAASTAAYGKTSYSLLVPTTEDSTSESSGQIGFRIIAGMEEGNFVSEVKSGYSVDNLYPSIPENLKTELASENGVELIWNNIADKDFKYFNVYRNTENLFNYTTPIYSQVLDTVFFDNQIETGTTYYYSITSVDYSGNESDFSKTSSVHITSISNEINIIPQVFFLNPNYPNPFNPSTTILYGLPETANVNIAIYDIIGRKIIQIMNKKQSAGTYQIEWKGQDEFSRNVASGIYIFSLKTDKFKKELKMHLVR